LASAYTLKQICPQKGSRELIHSRLPLDGPRRLPATCISILDVHLPCPTGEPLGVLQQECRRISLLPGMRGGIPAFLRPSQISSLHLRLHDGVEHDANDDENTPRYHDVGDLQFLVLGPAPDEGVKRADDPQNPMTNPLLLRNCRTRTKQP
jgi:hypothetical protein